ncbi:MAG: hypothetical protein QX196_13345, partial [Methylococcaceae bacterium]
MKKRVYFKSSDETGSVKIKYFKINHLIVSDVQFTRLFKVNKKKRMLANVIALLSMASASAYAA